MTMQLEIEIDMYRNFICNPLTGVDVFIMKMHKTNFEMLKIIHLRNVLKIIYKNVNKIETICMYNQIFYVRTQSLPKIIQFLC
jgi:hypothetical protein